MDRLGLKPSKEAKVIFGGTFDPIHQGHVNLAVELSDYLDVRPISLLPNHQPMHRSNPGALANDRAKMVSLAIAEHPQLVLDTRELERKGPSYSVLTLAEMRQEIGTEAPLIWCMGADAFAQLTSWNRWQELLDFGHLLVLSRPDSNWLLEPQLLDFYEAHKVDDGKQLLLSAAGKVAHLELGQYGVSATKIRKQLHLGNLPSANELSPAVAKYIASQSLYGIN